MNIRLLFETVVHLKPTQIIHQLIRRSDARGLTIVDAPESNNPKAIAAPIAKPVSLANGVLTFLNISDSFTDWNQTAHGALWNYNQNYMDWLLQPDLLPKEGIEWIDRFIENLPTNTAGLAPYPTALRSINWCKFFSLHQPFKNKERDTALYSQVKWLENNLEYRVLGNHLLEDAYALFIAAIYFSDAKLYVKASRLLNQQLQEQVLPDGAHYEQSPMYHCILLDRLLDCINYTSANTDNGLFPTGMNEFLIDCARAMTGHLKSIIWPDGTIPLLNDSAYGIAPQPSELLDYATRLGIESSPIPLKECGYRRLADGRINVIADVGNITAANQPGHTHADALSYELRIDGNPFIIDTGISTYNRNGRRQYERSTQAHNTVTVDGKDSSGVWDVFRVAGRARVRIEQDCDSMMVASHNGYGRRAIHSRSFRLGNNTFSIQDICYTAKDTVSRIHFAPDVRILSFDNSGIVTDKGTIQIEGAVRLDIKDMESSVEYNVSRTCRVAEISFRNRLTYTLHVNP